MVAPYERDSIRRTFKPHEENPRETWLIVQKDTEPANKYLIRFSNPETGKPFATEERFATFEEATQVLVFQSQRENPGGTKPYINPALIKVFHLESTKRTKVLRENGVRHFDMPEVYTGKLSDNEKAFYQGFALGNFQINPINWSKHDYLTIGTESADLERHRLLAETFGSKNTVRANGTKRPQTKVYLDPETFSFLLDTQISANMFDTKVRFAPFALGLLLGKLSNQHNRVTQSDGLLLKRVNKAFEKWYGFEMGRITKETREGKPLTVLTLAQPEAVLSALIQSPQVTDLPFFRNLFPPREK